MKLSRRKKMLALFATCSLGTTFQFGFGGGGCAGFAANGALTSFDFCGVVNCAGGSFFNFCSPTALLVDCPELQ
jgi:hypothetical protein